MSASSSTTRMVLGMQPPCAAVCARRRPLQRQDLSGPSLIGGVERRLETGVNASQPVDYTFGPSKVFPLPCFAPICRRPLGNVSNITNLVGKFYQLRLATDARGTRYLQRFPSLFGKLLI